MRKKGKLVVWDANKAFGFIQPNDAEKQIFIHKTAFSNKACTPQVNDIITFTLDKQKDGRPCAKEAIFSGEKRKTNKGNTGVKGGSLSIFLALLLLTAISLGYLTKQIPALIFLVYIGFSLLTFLVYAIDKSKAQRGAWRVQESSLHLMALLGGWPGAAIAQQWLRHKSQKQQFRRVFWLTVIVNIVALIYLLFLK